MGIQILKQTDFQRELFLSPSQMHIVPIPNLEQQYINSLMLGILPNRCLYVLRVDIPTVSFGDSNLTTDNTWCLSNAKTII